jgi:hypothetical protein
LSLDKRKTKPIRVGAGRLRGVFQGMFRIGRLNTLEGGGGVDNPRMPE